MFNNFTNTDEIWVERRKAEEKVKELELNQKQYPDHFQAILDSSEHSDVTFRLGEAGDEVLAHKVILCARSEVNSVKEVIHTKQNVHY